MAWFIIEGKNRTEFCKAKDKDIDRKRFFATRGMLYRGFPNQFTRMRKYEYGVETGTEEVIVYQENCIHAQQERGIYIDPDHLMCDIDEYKGMVKNTLGNKSWGKLSILGNKKLWSYWPYILCGVVLLYAVIANGGIGI